VSATVILEPAPSEVWIVSGSRRKPGPLGPFVDGFRAWLVGRGYSPSAVVRSLMMLGHLGRWLERNALAVDQLTAEAVSGFLAEYRDDRGRLPGASAWPLLKDLRAEGAVPPEPSPATIAPTPSCGASRPPPPVTAGAWPRRC
jgi:hypothetical protein